MDNVRSIHKNTEKISDLIKRRDELLETVPELKELQFKINDILAGAGNVNNKLVLMRELMIESLNELQSHNEDLANDLATFNTEWAGIATIVKGIQDE